MIASSEVCTGLAHAKFITVTAQSLALTGPRRPNAKRNLPGPSTLRASAAEPEGFPA